MGPSISRILLRELKSRIEFMVYRDISNNLGPLGVPSSFPVAEIIRLCDLISYVEYEQL